jgi:hypothetical protein
VEHARDRKDDRTGDQAVRGTGAGNDKNPLALLWRILVAARTRTGLDPEDAARLAAALVAALQTGTPLERGLGLSGRWRSDVKQAQRYAAITPKIAGVSTRAAARDLHSRLRRYRASAYPHDVSTGEPKPGNRDLFELLRSHAGAVPSISTLRRLLSRGSGRHIELGQRGVDQSSPPDSQS